MRDPLDNPMAGSMPGCGAGGCLLTLLIAVVLMILMQLGWW